MPKYTIEIDQGADFNLKMQWKSANNAPINTTAYTAKLQIKQRPKLETVLDLSTSNGGIVITNNGEITIRITHTQTALLTYTLYAYDLFITDSNNIVTKLLYGEVRVSPQVTI